MTPPTRESGIDPPDLKEAATRPRVPLRTVAAIFLRLGATSFGGPAAHIALMEDEFVRRRGWLTQAEFLDLLGATNLIPGPNSTEMAIHIGHRVSGWRGLLVAGACFTLPALLIVTVLAWVYVRYGKLPAVAAVLYCIKPVVIAVVVQALLRLGRVCIRATLPAVAAIVAIALAILGVHELVVLFGVGLAVPLLKGMFRRPGRLTPAPLVLLTTPAVPAATAAAGSVSFGLWPLFLVFLKTGAVLYGSGYVLLAFLRADLVGRYGWLTEQQLLDAVAVGQMIPGPLFTTAAFIGYLLGGPSGAAVATVGIFLPAFIFVALSIPLLPRLRRSAFAAAFLDGVNAASLALMAVVTVQLGRAALVDGITIALAVVSAALLLRYRLNATWVILGGAVAGLLRAAIVTA
jgi:chromate transporter